MPSVVPYLGHTQTPKLKPCCLEGRVRGIPFSNHTAFLNTFLMSPRAWRAGLRKEPRPEAIFMKVSYYLVWPSASHHVFLCLHLCTRNWAENHCLPYLGLQGIPKSKFHSAVSSIGLPTRRHRVERQPLQLPCEGQAGHEREWPGQSHGEL